MPMNDSAKQYYRNQGKTDEELQEIEREANSLPSKIAQGGQRKIIREWIRECAQERWKNGQGEITPQQVFEWAQRNKDYSAKDAKGIGDVMGEATGGLFLKLVSTKKGKKSYLIPDMDEFPDWYLQDAPLPSSYYGEDFFTTLCLSESRKSKTTFFDGRIPSENSEVGNV